MEKDNDMEIGAFVISIAALFSFLFPLAAKWILLGLAIIIVYVCVGKRWW